VLTILRDAKASVNCSAAGLITSFPGKNVSRVLTGALIVSFRWNKAQESL